MAKLFKLTLEEKIYGEYEIEADSVEEAKKKFWDEEVEKIDLGSVMKEAGGIEIIEVDLIEEDIAIID